MSIENFKKLFEILSSCESDYEDSLGLVKLFCPNYDEILTQLKTELSIDAEIETDSDSKNYITFDPTKLPYYFFWNEKKFRSQSIVKGENLFDKDIAIVFDDDQKQIYYSDEITYVGFETSTANCLLTNTKSYFEFLSFLKTQEHNEDSFFHFIDYYNIDNREIIFTFPKKEGKLSVPIPKVLPVSSSIDYRPNFNKFREAFEPNNRNLPKFIKAEISNFLTREEKEKRMEIWLDKMPQILEVAEQNFDVHIYELSLENVQKDYLDYKDKYFAQLREILGKITTQIIGLPLSVSTTIFVTYQVKGSVWIIVSLITVLVVYSIFAVFLLKLQRHDVEDIEKRFIFDFDKLKNSQFFVKNKNLIAPFEETKVQVTNKIQTLKITIWVYFVILLITNILLLSYLFQYLLLQLWQMLLFILIYLVVQFFIFYINNLLFWKSP